MQANFFLRFVHKQALFRILMGVFFISYLAPGILFAQQKLYDDLFSVSFPNEKEGWTCGRWGAVLHTGDGGKTWARQETKTDFTLSSVYFVDSQNGWAVGDEGTIIHTQDGGKTWEKQKSPVPFLLMRVFFATPTMGWIVTEQTHILHTNDGGKTWHVQFKDQDFILKSVSFANPQNGWAVGEYGFIYHTSNGGMKWEKQAGKFEFSDKTGDVEGGNFLFDVVAVGPQTAWAVGIDGYVIRTLNGGKTWQEVHTNAGKAQLFCISSDKKETVVIGGDGTFVSSSDNGATWKAPIFHPPIIYSWIYGVGRRGESGFIAVGRKGTIYLSERGNTPSGWHQVH